MTDEELDQAVESVKKLREYFDELESRPAGVCGLCRRKITNSSCMYVEGDMPFDTAFHMECMNLVRAREQHVILRNLQAPFGAKKWLDNLKSRAWERFKKLKEEFGK